MKNKYLKKEWLKKVNRVHPPRDQQKVDNRLRLHRAERLHSFSTNFFNNFVKSITQKDIRYYPNTHDLKDKLSKKFNLNNNNILMNNGSSENIRIFYQAFAVKNKEVIITNPCYPMHKIYAELQNSIIKEVEYNENKTINYNDIISNINEETCCIVLANPNSPVGDILDLKKVEEIIKFADNRDLPILIDEAYIEYAEQKSCVYLLKKYNNLIISRTFSKGLGCAGLRIGYLLGNDKIMEIINKFIPTYEISSLSTKFGSYLLDNYNVVEEYLLLIKDEKRKVGNLCKQNNIQCILNHINTIHLKPNNFEEIIKYLKKENILYRTRILPHDEEPWLAIVLYPKFTESEIFKNIVISHNNLL